MDYKQYHHDVHQVFALAAILGFLSHFIRTLPLLVNMLKWVETIIEEDEIPEASSYNAIKWIQFYTTSEVYDVKKDTLVENGLNLVIPDIYEQRASLLERISDLDKRTTPKNLKGLVDFTEEFYRDVETRFLSFAIEFVREATNLRLR